ncbi:MAG TPA: hypothetical protein VJ951_15855, partial [Bacteroidales bacterium]|nr:hypothetical protein [Bacteroidales bacterium]
FILPKLISYTENEKQKEAWRKMFDDLPELPIGGEKGNQRLLAAEKGKPHSKHENPELYAVFPYKLYGMGKPDLAIARNAWPHRTNTVNSGWSQNGIHAAMLGFTDEAKEIVLENFGKPASGFRFPGFYGPNYDWVPDQDHGSTTMIAVQKMLMQTSGDKILLLPAWPKEWDVDFKLHAPKNTTVEGTVKNGEITRLKVTPEERKKDIVNKFNK